jgi:hypothetical protein
LTPRLRATLLRISQGLEEQRLRYFIAQTPTSPATAPNASSISSMPSEMQSGSVFGGAVIVMTASNLCALKVEVGIKRAECFVQERKVATQSLSCLADMLKRSRPWLQAMLPQNCLASVEYFYARTVCLKNFSKYFWLFLSFFVSSFYAFCWSQKLKLQDT